MKLRPFAGLHPADSTAAEKLVSPPYDVLSRTEARNLLAQGVCAFLRVVRPDATLPDASADDEGAAIAAAGVALDDLQSSLLVRAASPALFVYELRRESSKHVQRGVAALVSIDDYAAGAIRRHEHTRRDKELQRAALADALCAHTGPVLLAHRRSAAVAAAVAAVADARPPDLRVVQAGVMHSVWRCDDAVADALVAAYADDVPAAVIADGHHRAAGAMRVGLARRAAGGTQMDRASDWFPAVLFPADELVSRPYYRVVRDLGPAADPHADPHAFLAAVKQAGIEISPLPGLPVDDPVQHGCVYMALRGSGDKVDDKFPVSWFAIHLTQKEGDVDSQTLQDKLLGPVLGVTDPRTDERVAFVGGTGLHELHNLVATGEAAVAFAPRAVSAAEVLTVVDNGAMMPPKSTWFDPKLCSGFFVHTF